MSTVDKNTNQIIPSFVKKDGFVVYPITHNLVDLFWGNGFENSARFKWTGQDWVLRNKNNSLPKGCMQALNFYIQGVKS